MTGTLSVVLCYNYYNYLLGPLALTLMAGGGFVYTSFKSAYHTYALCHSLALLARRLCMSLVDPKGLAALMACRLIAQDKYSGVRPIWICKTTRRIFATKSDLQDAAGSIKIDDSLNNTSQHHSIWQTAPRCCS